MVPGLKLRGHDACLTLTPVFELSSYLPSSGSMTGVPSALEILLHGPADLCISVRGGNHSSYFTGGETESGILTTHGFSAGMEVETVDRS